MRCEPAKADIKELPVEFDVEMGGAFFLIPLLLIFRFDQLTEGVVVARNGISAIHFHLSLFFMNVLGIRRINHLNDLNGSRDLFALLCGTSKVLDQSGIHRFLKSFKRMSVDQFIASTAIRSAKLMEATIKIVNIDIHSTQRFTKKDIAKTKISSKNRCDKATSTISVQDQLNKLSLYLTSNLEGRTPAKMLINCICKLRNMFGKFPEYVCFDLGFYNGRVFRILDGLSIRFITLLRRGTKAAEDIDKYDISLFNSINLDPSYRKYRKAKVYDIRINSVTHYSKELRMIVTKFTGKRKRVAFLTNDLHSPAKQIIEKYAKRWRIENWFKDAKDFFNIDDMPGFDEVKLDAYLSYKHLTSNIFALLKREVGVNYEPATFYRKFICVKARVEITNTEVVVTYKHFREQERFEALFGNMNERLRELGIDPHVPWWGNRVVILKFSG